MYHSGYSLPEGWMRVRAVRWAVFVTAVLVIAAVLFLGYLLIPHHSSSYYPPAVIYGWSV